MMWLRLIGVLVTILALWLGYHENKLVTDHHKGSSCKNLQLGEENPAWDADLHSNLDSIQGVVARLMEARARGKADDPDPQGRYRRVQHPLSWGCTEATVELDPPADLEGVLASKGKYNAVVRLSKNAFDPDNEFKGTAIALKVLGVHNQPRATVKELNDGVGAANKDTWDLLMISAPTLPLLTTPREAAEVHEALIAGSTNGALLYLAKNRPTVLFRALRVFYIGMGISNVFAAKHFTVIPSRIGEKQAAKFAMFPCSDHLNFKAATPSKEYIGAYMQDFLNDQEGCMKLMMQRQRDPCIDQIDDFMFEWQGPWEQIGVVRVKKGARLVNDDKCEALSFNPYHAPEANKPLGWISRLRRDLYAAGVAMRTAKNKKN